LPVLLWSKMLCDSRLGAIAPTSGSPRDIVIYRTSRDSSPCDDD